MRYLNAIILLLWISCLAALGADDGTAEAEILKKTTAFWSLMTAGDYEKAKGEIFVVRDDPAWRHAEMFAGLVAEEFEELVKHLQAGKQPPRMKEIAVDAIRENRGRMVAVVKLMIWEPREQEFEKLTLAWVKSTESGWRIADL